MVKGFLDMLDFVKNKGILLVIAICLLGGTLYIYYDMAFANDESIQTEQSEKEELAKNNRHNYKKSLSVLNQVLTMKIARTKTDTNSCNGCTNSTAALAGTNFYTDKKMF